MALTTTDKLVEIAGWILIFSLWVLTITNYTKLPGIIPTHFNAAGQVDGLGRKSNLLTLPLVASMLFTGLTILNKCPHIFNYPVTITSDNAQIQYTYATRLIRYLKVIMVVILGSIEWQTIRNANGQSNGLGSWFLPLTLALFYFPVTYFVVKLGKTNQ